MVRSKTQRLKYLRETVKKCYYCKTNLVYYPLERHEKTPDNFATIEHLNSKLQYPNGRPKAFGKTRTLVVACFKCNIERSAREVSKLSKEEVWERSGSKPLGEDTCERCISPNPVWHTTNELWNKFAGDYRFLCPNCFIELADDGKTDIWELAMNNTNTQAKE